MITISGNVFPTGISTFIRILYTTNPITQMIIFGTYTARLLLSCFNRKKSAIWIAIIGANTEWYFVDVMCDDPYIAGEDREGIFRYERLLRTESELRGSSDLYSGEFKYEKNIDNFGYKFSNMPTGTNAKETFLTYSKSY